MNVEMDVSLNSRSQQNVDISDLPREQSSDDFLEELSQTLLTELDTVQHQLAESEAKVKQLTYERTVLNQENSLLAGKVLDLTEEVSELEAGVDTVACFTTRVHTFLEKLCHDKGLTLPPRKTTQELLDFVERELLH
ncbi:hypothetical protein P9112_011346 [Eukaryota sp. TZLM1-RC]